MDEFERLNVRISRAKTMLKDVEEELEYVKEIGTEMEMLRLSTKEDQFYKLLKLPRDTNFAQFFLELGASADLAVEMVKEFTAKYPESFEKLGKGPLPPEMSAFNGYLWLKTTDLDSFKERDKSFVLGVWNVIFRLMDLDYKLGV